MQTLLGLRFSFSLSRSLPAFVHKNDTEKKLHIDTHAAVLYNHALCFISPHSFYSRFCRALPTTQNCQREHKWPVWNIFVLFVK